jgi:predicted nucleic acid-binding Zn ribbon protein
MVGRILGELGHGEAARVLRIAAQWEPVVGAEIAGQAEPVRLRGNVLEVRVASSVWANHLQLRRDEILAGLAQLLGSDAPTDLRFHVG